MGGKEPVKTVFSLSESAQAVFLTYYNRLIALYFRFAEHMNLYSRAPARAYRQAYKAQGSYET